MGIPAALVPFPGWDQGQQHPHHSELTESESPTVSHTLCSSQPVRGGSPHRVPPCPTESLRVPPLPLPRPSQHGSSPLGHQEGGRSPSSQWAEAAGWNRPMSSEGSAFGSQWRRGLARREAAAHDGGRGREDLAGSGRYVRAEADPGRTPRRPLPVGTAEGTGGVNVPALPSYTPSLYLCLSPCPHAPLMFSSQPRSALIHQQQGREVMSGCPGNTLVNKPKLLSRESQEAEKPLWEPSGAPGSGSAAAGSPPEPG